MPIMTAEPEEVILLQYILCNWPFSPLTAEVSPVGTRLRNVYGLNSRMNARVVMQC